MHLLGEGALDNLHLSFLTRGPAVFALDGSGDACGDTVSKLKQPRSESPRN